MARIAIVKKDDCSPTGCGDYLCAKLCPVNREGQDCIVPAEDKKAEIDEGLCIGCAICVNRCPFNAIDIINLPEALKSEPIHRFGKNGFSLFNLPTPMFGKVIGVLGVNGIGKSTAIKILAGVLKPNLGSQEKEAGYEDLITFFKGTESQNFFEKIANGEITIAYKPQSVDLIPKQVKGTVKDLLKKADQTNRYQEIVEKFELKKIEDREINQISGGELQRVAIAATIMKKANLYVFDEPTSYLDIKQRIKIAKIIKELANEETAVLVIEHDLIILDYMTDLVHLMYGKEGAFGVVSQPKTTRVGINIYLTGYLREENVRFRDHEIKFGSKPPIQESSDQLQVSWKEINKKLGNFELSAKLGEIYKDDVIGILGENGIGKTSFVKILAEVIKPDTGKVDEAVKVSYKPQYLESSDELVMNLLQDALQKYEVQLIKPLNITPLLTKKISQLSGGEMQRVAIAACLSKKAGLYLLDEPSAYLDVEQRLKVSKIIREVMEQRGTSALIVDHDLLFVDYLSKKLIVFDGEPAVNGEVMGPFVMQEGMNKFLRDIGMTFRRDEESNRPRANKEGSVKDREQISENKLYYT